MRLYGFNAAPGGVGRSARGGAGRGGVAPPPAPRSSIQHQQHQQQQVPSSVCGSSLASTSAVVESAACMPRTQRGSRRATVSVHAGNFLSKLFKQVGAGVVALRWAGSVCGLHARSWARWDARLTRLQLSSPHCGPHTQWLRLAHPAIPCHATPSCCARTQDPSAGVRRKYQPRVDEINALEARMQPLTDDQLRAKTQEFKQRAAGGESLDSLLPEAFAVGGGWVGAHTPGLARLLLQQLRIVCSACAPIRRPGGVCRVRMCARTRALAHPRTHANTPQVVREASNRVLGLRPFDVQLMGGMILHEGQIAEMRTGEVRPWRCPAPARLLPRHGVPVWLVCEGRCISRWQQRHVCQPRVGQWPKAINRSGALHPGLRWPGRSIARSLLCQLVRLIGHLQPHEGRAFAASRHNAMVVLTHDTASFPFHACTPTHDAGQDAGGRAASVPERPVNQGRARGHRQRLPRAP